MYYLHKVKHELCFINDIVNLGSNNYSITMPVLMPKSRLTATDGRMLMQRIIFQHFNSAASKSIGFKRGMITLCSEPDDFQVHFLMNCSVDQLAEPSENEWIKTIEHGLDYGLEEPPLESSSENVKLNIWGIKDYIYDLKIEFWPHHDKPNSFLCDCLVKYIKPEGKTDINELNFSNGFTFDIYHNKSKTYLPFLIKSEAKPFFFLNEASVNKVDQTVNEDGIGHELFIQCEINP
jgi:hypothetical protein